MSTALPTRTSRVHPVRVDFEVWSTTATLVVTEPAALEIALAELNDELAAVDATCSRFRTDSEISRLLLRPGRAATLSPLLNEVITAALRIAEATDYLLDPTVAAAVINLGYDRDIGGVVMRVIGDEVLQPHGFSRDIPAPGCWLLRHDPESARLLVPPGVGIDLGLTAKAFAADRAAQRIARLIDGGVLVSLGGDIAVAGQAPPDGWQIEVADDHRAGPDTHQLVSITSGGLATSSTATRRWRTRSGWAHHIIDPRSGGNPAPGWRTAAVAAASCLDANAASTAAIVLGPAAPDWLTRQGLPALLVDQKGAVTTIGGWPQRAGTA